ncbi:MAG TPA: hypothetical protein VME66_08385 [Candidatus Acidoferrales bacterium]|nr:hypothetical protein [Candidatus Acidoferrales bacterium]
MSQSSVRVFYMPANGKPEFREITDDTRLAETLSSASFDRVDLPRDLVMYCDRDEPCADRGYSFTIHGHFVHGDAFFVRRSGTRIVSVTDDDVAAILSLST